LYLRALVVDGRSPLAHDRVLVFVGIDELPAPHAQLAQGDAG